MESQDDEEVYLTTRQVMGILNCSRQYVSKLRNTGKLSSYRRGNEYLLSAKEIEALITKKTIIVKLKGAHTHG
jgi:excisionase family DNA binding protein